MINVTKIQSILNSLSSAIEASNNLHFCGGGEYRNYWRLKAEKHLKEVKAQMPELLLSEGATEGVDKEGKEDSSPMA